MKRFLPINGSHRNGNTDILVKNILEKFGGSANFQEIRLRDLKWKCLTGVSIVPMQKYVRI